MSQLHNIIIRPILTEKSTTQMDDLNKVTFKVDRKATKTQVRRAVEELFGVKVVKVNTHTIPGKPKRVGRRFTRTSGYKKATVTLAEGDMIDFFALEEDDFVEDEDGVIGDEFGPEDFAEGV